MDVTTLLTLFLSTQALSVDMQFCNATKDVALVPFTVTTEETRFVTQDGPFKFDPSSVQLFKNTDETVFLAAFTRNRGIAAAQ